jgi:hypothetical protein
MVVPSAAQLQGFAGGQMTDLPEFTGAFDGTELFEIVAPGNEADGINYSVASARLAAFIIQTISLPTFVLSGSVYNSVATDTRILVNKTVGSATSVVLLGGASYLQPVLVKDLKGDAAAHPITVTFASGTMDGLTSVVISNPFGYFWFNPLASGNFYDAAF